MDSSRMWLIFLVCYLAFASCAPLPFLFGGGYGTQKNDSTIAVPVLYENLPLEDIPTTVGEDVVLSSRNFTRYGYLFGRPVARVTQFLSQPVGIFLKSIL